MNRSNVERKFLRELDINRWLQLRHMQGDVIPDDPQVALAMMQKARMEDPEIPMELRIDSRDWLTEKGIEFDDHGLTPLEKMEKSGRSKGHPGMSIRVMATKLEDVDQVVCIFPNERVLTIHLNRAAEQLRGNLDLVRSNARRKELYTLDGRHIKFLLDDEEFTPSDGEVAYRVITSAI